MEFEPRAVSRLAPYRLPGEQIKVAMQEHWAARVEPAATASVAFVLVIAINGTMPSRLDVLSNLSWWLWFTLLIRLGWILMNWQVSWFIATNRRLLLLYGIVVRKVAMMPLSKVTDMSYSRTPMGMLLGYGTFTLESAGQEQALQKITYVRDPDRTYRIICGQIFYEPPPTAAPPTTPPDDDDGRGRGPYGGGNGGGGGGRDDDPDGPLGGGDPDPEVPLHRLGSYLVGPDRTSFGSRMLRRGTPPATPTDDPAQMLRPRDTRHRSTREERGTPAADHDPGWSVSHEDAPAYERVGRDTPSWWD